MAPQLSNVEVITSYLFGSKDGAKALPVAKALEEDLAGGQAGARGVPAAVQLRAPIITFTRGAFSAWSDQTLSAHPHPTPPHRTPNTHTNSPGQATPMPASRAW